MHRIVTRAALGAVLAGSLGAIGTGCLSRPVTKQAPTLKTNFTASVRQQAVDKIDLLFMIDNSESMGDKQELLAQAVPDLVTRLINPNCLDITSGNIVGVSQGGTCPANQKPEFPAVHDMHIGVVSSSLGTATGDVCPDAKTNDAFPTLNAHNNDQGHLLNRGGVGGAGDEHDVADAGKPSNFLAWFPSVDANTGKPAPPVPAITDSAKLASDFTDVVRGVHEHGCGIEAQLESWYHFLVQPDPYQQVIKDTGTKVKLDGFDDVVLAQRAAFLRPDSLLAVIVVTDETEEFVDPMALDGQGWAFMNQSFPGSNTGAAPKPTQACAANPNDAACTSCAFNSGDPGCKPNVYYDPADDDLNVRAFHMKQRFGVEPRFPIARYVRALTLPTVPNRSQEHQPNNANYLGEQLAGCRNPIFAKDLPTDSSGGPDSLCNLTAGPRTKDLVFFAAIVGVPHQLLQEDPNNPDSPQKATISDADWVKILGNDPLNYDFGGADPHMLQSIVARPTLKTGPGDTVDPINGREWDTKKGDIQFSCVFNLKTPKDCSLPQFHGACDCEQTTDAPLCDPNNKKLQIRGKAYPSIRELSVARQLKDQAIVSSLCPIHETEKTPGDPLFGYRPAVKAIIDRLKNALANQCLPQPLQGDAQGNVPCLILETLGSTGDESVCNDPAHGFKIPDAQVLKNFRDQQKAAAGPGEHPEQFPVCEVTQLVGPDLLGGSCAASQKPGWCYVTGTAAGTCPQAILFSPTGNPQVGSSISLQCIEQQTGGTTSPDGG